MTVTVDRDNDPWIHASGTIPEVLGHLKSEHVLPGACCILLFKGNVLNCIYEENCPTIKEVYIIAIVSASYVLPSLEAGISA